MSALPSRFSVYPADRMASVTPKAPDRRLVLVKVVDRW